MEKSDYVDHDGKTKGELKIHYYLPNNSHEMDALVRNRCEGEILGLLKEIGRILGVAFTVDTVPSAPGGLEEHLLLVGEYKEQIFFIKDIALALMTAGGGFGGLLFVKSKLKHASQQTTLNDLAIEKARLEIEKMRQEVERTQGENESLQLEGSLSAGDVAVALLSRKKVMLKRSNFYREVTSYHRVEAVGFSNSHDRSAGENVVPRDAFSSFIVGPEDLEPELYKKVEIEVVSPVLKTGIHNWRGLFQRKGISFEMADSEFRRSVLDQEVQFQNGTKMICDLEVHQRDNEVGEPEVTKRVVRKVYSIAYEPKSSPEVQGELDLSNPSRPDLPGWGDW